MERALIVGASSGIGRELAHLMVSDGYKVGITGRRLELLREIEATRPESYLISCFDCASMENTLVLEKIAKELGTIDIIVISAGMGEINKTLDFAIEDQTNMLNVRAFTELASWAFNYFTRIGRGQLVAITSIAGIRGGRVAPAYNASKAYQIHDLEGLRQRAKRLKLPVTITDIRPGFVDTAMAKGGGKFWVVPEEKAGRQIYRHILNKREIAYVSHRWRLIAWLLKILPQSIYKQL